MLQILVPQEVATESRQYMYHARGRPKQAKRGALRLGRCEHWLDAELRGSVTNGREESSKKMPRKLRVALVVETPVHVLCWWHLCEEKTLATAVHNRSIDLRKHGHEDKHTK